MIPELGQLALSIALVVALVVSQTPPATIRLIVKADDMGAGHGVNVATIDAYRNGVVTLPSRLRTSP